MCATCLEQKRYDVDALACQSSRLAMWHLLVHSRMHPEVMIAVSDECARLADYVVVPAYRTVQSDDIEADARSRLGLFPSLLHLISRASLDGLSSR